MNLQINYEANKLRDKVIDFVQENHYSRSCRSQMQKHVFTASVGQELKGVAIYGLPMGRNCDPDMIELRRFCLAPGAEKNTASWFLSQTLRWLQKFEHDYSRVLSFADPNRGHKGTIYLASNFKYDGVENNGNPRVVMVGDRQVHMRQYYQKKNGVYTDDALRYQRMVANGQAEIVPQQRKLRFIYNLR
jgi:hypothetical protein